jgi:sialate O-acetylesterase
MKSSSLRFLVGILATTAISNAAVQLASPFGEHMVLQQGRAIPVWGMAEVGEKVTVEFATEKKSATAGADGKWRLDLDTLPASAKGRTFTVTGSATPLPIKLDDVLVGEVWICGGQSNMERQLGPRPPQKPIVDWEQEVAAADHPLIRQFYVEQKLAPTPQSSLTGKWTVCSPATVADFTAVGYFFARDLQKAMNVPIGIIHSSWGGTPAEAWTSRAGLKNFPEFKEGFAQLDLVAVDPVAAKRSYLAHLDQWYRDNDPGSGEHPWSEPTLETTGWESMELPVYWENAGHAGFDGVVWYRKTFDLVEGWNGADLDLRLSSIDDIDTTWVNGTKVGATSGWQTPRAYHVPASLLKPTGNVISVRVLDTGGNGGIWNPDLPFEITSADGKGAKVPLAGPWLCRFSTSLSKDSKNHPPADMTQGAGVPTVLYNAMIAPLEPFAIRGVTFYQGETNADRAHQYRTLFPALIADWRKHWGQGNFPFLFVQVAPFDEMPPEIREAQLLALQATKNTAMVVTIDCGDAGNIHPAHKQPVGARLALAARALAYGEPIEYSGPVFAGMKTEGNRAVISFSHLGGGLVGKEGALTGFTIAGSDGAFHPAKAEVNKDTVVVSARDVAAPAAVRYGWANVASGNLFNRAGLPASPFRTDVTP